MGQHILNGNPPISLELRRSARARRISLRVSGVDGRVTLTVPTGIRDSEALDFATEKASWLRTQIAKRPNIERVGHGTILPLEGRQVDIRPGTGRLVQLQSDTLWVPGQADQAGARVQAFLKQRARERLVERADAYAAKLSRPYTRISLRDTRSRWGSCSSHGGLMFSWRLIMAPPDVLDYVAAHEVAHLAQMNHSQAFWDIVEKLYGPYDTQRRWLRENGALLHGFRFVD